MLTMITEKVFHLGKVKIAFKVGDLTQEKADALVNAANNEGWMGGGVAGAIRRAGGREIEDEAVKKGPVAVGEAWATGAGSLGAEYVIHAAVMAMDFNTDYDKIYRSTTATIKRADEMGLKTIAFPAFGTGVGRFPAGKAGEAMLSAVRDSLLHRETKIESIVFVLYNRQVYDDFVESAENTIVSNRR